MLSVFSLILPEFVLTTISSVLDALRSTNWSLRLLNLSEISPRSPLLQSRILETESFLS